MVGDPPRARRPARLGLRRRPRLSSASASRRRHVVLAGDDRDAVAQAVERLVGEPVGVLVLLARHPGVRRPERRQPVGLQRQRLHVGVLDLPAARHLLDDELGVHPDLDVGVGRELLGQPQPGDQAGVLRDVVGGDADRRCRPRRSPRRCRRPSAPRRTPPGRGCRASPPSASITTGVGSRSRLTEPALGVRTRIRWHSSQRITSSSAAARIRPSSAVSRVSRQPPHSRARSAAAPTPPLRSRSRS